jgi:hypothetical protein
MWLNGEYYFKKFKKKIQKKKKKKNIIKISLTGARRGRRCAPGDNVELRRVSGCDPRRVRRRRGAWAQASASPPAAPRRHGRRSDCDAIVLGRMWRRAHGPALQALGKHRWTVGIEKKERQYAIKYIDAYILY